MHMHTHIHTHTRTRAHTHTHTMEYYSAIKNEILSFATCIKLECIMLSEISQRKTNTIISLTYGI